MKISGCYVWLWNLYVYKVILHGLNVYEWLFGYVKGVYDYKGWIETNSIIGSWEFSK